MLALAFKQNACIRLHRTHRLMNRHIVTTFAMLISATASGFAGAQESEKKDDAKKIKLITVGDTPRVSTSNNKMFFAGQPTEADFAKFAELGVKTVINLRRPEEVAELGFDEKAAVEAAGMRYVHAPMGRELPKEEVQKLLAKEFDKAQKAPVLLHCAGSNRVGAVWAAYRSKKGVDIDEAVAEGKAAGMRAQAFEEAVRAQAGDE